MSCCDIAGYVRMGTCVWSMVGWSDLLNSMGCVLVLFVVCGVFLLTVCIVYLTWISHFQCVAIPFVVVYSDVCCLNL